MNRANQDEPMLEGAAVTPKDRAGRFIARYRDAFPDVLDAWPTDHPMPNFPGIITRLGLADKLTAEFAETEHRGFEQGQNAAAKHIAERFRAVLLHDSVKDHPIPVAIWDLLRNIEHEVGIKPIDPDDPTDDLGIRKLEWSGLPDDPKERIAKLREEWESKHEAGCRCPECDPDHNDPRQIERDEASHD